MGLKRISWRKGLTKETDERVSKAAEKSSKTKKRLFKEGKLIPHNKGKKFSEESKIKMRKAWTPKRRREQSKRNITMNTGEKHTKEHIMKNRLAHLGKNNHFYGEKHTKETKEKMKKSWTSERRKKHAETSKMNAIGRKASDETRRKMREQRIGEKNSFYGKKHTKETLNRISGENAVNWRGGISFEPYGKEFNNHLREQIRQRDQYRCQQCFRHQSELRTKKNNPRKLDIHHINFIKTDNNPQNLISLCLNCHNQTQFNREQWTRYFQDRIGGMI